LVAHGDEVLPPPLPGKSRVVDAWGE
jgi:hypothetical protein